MGYYLNPAGEKKEAFLDREGLVVGMPSWPPPEGNLLVCLVSNPMFTAAGIAYDEREFLVFRDDRTGRPKKWYHVPQAKAVAAMLENERNAFKRFMKIP